MRIYMVIFVLALMISAGDVVGMGKSDSSKEEVESSLDKKGTTAVPIKEDAESSAEKESTPPAKAEAKAESAEEKVDTPEAKEASKPVADKVVVTVNGVRIMQSLVDKQIEAELKRMKDSGRNLPANMMKSFREQRTKAIAQQMIGQQLIAEKLKAENIKITDKQIDDRIAEFAGRSNMPMEQLEKQLAMSGMKMADFRERMRSGLGLEKLMELSGKPLSATAEEAKKFYDEKIQAGQIRASHILLDTRGKDEVGKTEAKAKIEELLKQVKAGADFAALAGANSDCPSRSKGGDLGFFGKDQMVPPFSEAAFALKEGEISDVVETQFGYHIIKKLGFADVKNSIMSQVENEKKRKLSVEFLNGLKAEAKLIWPEKEKAE